MKYFFFPILDLNWKKVPLSVSVSSDLRRRPFSRDAPSVLGCHSAVKLQVCRPEGPQPLSQPMMSLLTPATKVAILHQPYIWYSARAPAQTTALDINGPPRLGRLSFIISNWAAHRTNLWVYLAGGEKGIQRSLANIYHMTYRQIVISKNDKILLKKKIIQI